MSKKEPEVIDAEVIDAELIDDDGHPVDENAFERITREGAEVMDAIADTAKFISPETAEEIRGHAASVRNVREKVSTTATAGKKFIGSVSEFAEKLGIRDRFVMVRREHPRAAR